MEDVIATLPDVAEGRGRGRPPKDRPAPVEIDEARVRQEIAERVRQRREAAGLSMRDLAAAADVSVQTLQAVEGADGDPKAITLLKIAKALGCPAGWLAYGG